MKCSPREPGELCQPLVGWICTLRPRVLVAQFGGAAGTLASLGEGEASLASRGELARELGLAEPEITWHVARDGIAETVQFLALLGGSLGKIAFDVMLMSATSVITTRSGVCSSCRKSKEAMRESCSKTAPPPTSAL